MSRINATLPPQVAVLLRGALQHELIRACEDAPAARPESLTRAGWRLVLSRLDAAFHGLDVIGWEEPDEQRPVTIALDRTMIDALETDTEHWEWASEQQETESAEGRARAARHLAAIEEFLASLPERPAPLMIPIAAIPLVRECAQEGIPTVAEAINGTELDLRECSRRLNAIADLLDAIGWSEDEEPTEVVDATEHASVVMEMAEPLLETLKTAVSDAQDDDAKRAKAESELRLLSEVYAQASDAPGG